MSDPKQQDMLEQGRELLFKKDYRGALELFNILLSREAGFTLSIDARFMALDQRATALIKLDDLPSALQDGRRMIKVKKGDSQGYLRTGTVCEYLGKQDMALDVYNLGLENVLPTEPRFALLQRKREWMTRKCKTCDPLQVLSLDLVELVIKQLTFAKLTQLLRVSKLWYTTLTALPSLWTHLDLTHAHHPVSINTIRDYIRRSKNGLARASVHTFKSRNDMVFCDALLRCPTLKHLDVNLINDTDIDDCTLLKSIPSFAGLQVLVVSASFVLPFDRVVKLLGSCQTLTRAEFHHVEGSIIDDADWTDDVSDIRSLSINAVPNVTMYVPPKDLTKFFKRIPKIEHLRCFLWHFDACPPDFTMLKNLSNLDLTKSSLWLFPRLPESIQVLNLSGCVFSPGNTFHPLLQDSIYQNRLPNLKALLLACIHSLVGDWVRSLLSANKGNLVWLNLAYCPRLEQADINSLIHFGYLKAITVLSLAGCEFTDETAQLLTGSSPELEDLDIERTAVTGVGVKALVLKPGRKLEKLKLNSCRSISLDAVDFARASGIDVQFFIHEPRMTTKRMRRR